MFICSPVNFTSPQRDLLKLLTFFPTECYDTCWKAYIEVPTVFHVKPFHPVFWGNLLVVLWLTSSHDPIIPPEHLDHGHHRRRHRQLCHGSICKASNHRCSMAFDGDPLPANGLRQKAVWGQWRAHTRYVYYESIKLDIMFILKCVFVCVSHRISCIWQNVQIVWTIENKEKPFCPDVNVTVSNNARLNSASVGSQASAASGSWRTEGWNPRMIWLMIENPISRPMMGFWTFQVVTWISTINTRHPWLVSSLIHKMPTPPPVSCASGGLLQPQ